MPYEEDLLTFDFMHGDPLILCLGGDDDEGPDHDDYSEDSGK